MARHKSSFFERLTGSQTDVHRPTPGDKEKESICLFGLVSSADRRELKVHVPKRTYPEHVQVVTRGRHSHSMMARRQVTLATQRGPPKYKQESQDDTQKETHPELIPPP